MVIKIPKGTSEEKIRAMLNISMNKENEPLIDKFFGKLPHLKDGLKTQKKLRREWK